MQGSTWVPGAVGVVVTALVVDVPRVVKLAISLMGDPVSGPAREL